jgi:hypothetical protein
VKKKKSSLIPSGDSTEKLLKLPYPCRRTTPVKIKGLLT